MGRATRWNLRFGAAGEEYASRWLRARGLTIETCGYRCREGELDIVAREGRQRVIVEVKARSSDRWGGALAAVGARKQARIIAATRRYLWERGDLGAAVRFDVLALIRRQGGVEVEWVRDAFRA